MKSKLMKKTDKFNNYKISFINLIKDYRSLE